MLSTKGEVKNWASLLEENTLEQARKLARSPAVVGHVALMPDAHLGRGATVGSVIPTNPYTIIPSAVGVDIGCGMIAVRTTLTGEDLPADLQPLHAMVAEAIPAGVGRQHRRAQYKGSRWLIDNLPPTKTARSMLDLAGRQLGSLGSGNHFVEVCLDEQDRVWGLLHSGSRGIGNKLATKAIEAAKANCKEAGVQLEDPDLAFLTVGEPEYSEYVANMEWAQDYARHNREMMMDALLECLFTFVGRGEEVERINCHHNFSRREVHFGQLVWLTRKGAISARVGEMGILPGSMGAPTHIVRGLSNPDAYHSAPHGAGRRLSRGKAKRELSLDVMEVMMEGKAWNKADAQALLDEHPIAYKDLATVRADSRDLVEPVHSLVSVLNYKGL